MKGLLSGHLPYIYCNVIILYVLCNITVHVYPPVYVYCTVEDTLKTTAFLSYMMVFMLNFLYGVLLCRFIRSLAQSHIWHAKGGKNVKLFCKTRGTAPIDPFSFSILYSVLYSLYSYGFVSLS